MNILLQQLLKLGWETNKNIVIDIENHKKFIVTTTFT